MARYLMCNLKISIFRSSYPEVFLGKVVLKMCFKFTGEHPCRGVISITVLCNGIEITLRHGWSPANLKHIFRTPFIKNTSRRLLLYFESILKIFFRTHQFSDHFRNKRSSLSCIFIYQHPPLVLQLKRTDNFYLVVFMGAEHEHVHRIRYIH